MSSSTIAIDLADGQAAHHDIGVDGWQLDADSLTFTDVAGCAWTYNFGRVVRFSVVDDEATT